MMEGWLWLAIFVALWLSRRNLEKELRNSKARERHAIEVAAERTLEYNKMVDVALNWKRRYEQAVRSSRRVTVSVPAQPKPQLDSKTLTKMISLCHPDKHGNSEASTEVTQMLLDMRRKSK